MRYNNIKYIGALAFAVLLNKDLAFAQKQTDTQEGNLLVGKIKVDGNANDWKIPLKAFNKGTGINYTIANDDKKLYLIIQANEANTTRKILMGGITFSINADGKKKSKELASLTFPVITRNSRRAAMGGGGGGGQRSFGSYQTMTQEQRDSMQNAFGQKQLDAAKDIKISGFKNVTDSLVSIYNEYSIKAIANLDANGTYTYEIGIPLDLLPVDITKEFGYNIKVNGLQMGSFGGGNNENANRGGGGAGAGAGGNRSFGGNGGGGGGSSRERGGFDFQDLITPTDFWGKYTIAK